MSQISESEMETIRESVKEFINIIDVNNSEVPTTEIEIVENDEESGYDIKTTTVPRPSELVDNYKEIGTFDEVVEEILNSDSHHDEQILIERTGEGKLPNLRLFSEDQDRKESNLKRSLRDLAGTVMDYNKEIEYSDDAFESAVKSRLSPWFEDDSEAIVIIPIHGIEKLDSDIDIDFSKTIELDYEIEDEIDDPSYNIEDVAEIDVKDIEISEISEEELTAIKNAESPRTQPTVSHNLPQHKIQIEMSYIINDIISKELADMIVTVLRMFDPFSDYDAGTAYTRMPDRWLVYDEKIPELRTPLIPVEKSENRAGVDDNTHVTQSDKEEIEDLWEDLYEYLPSSIIEGDVALSRPIQRFNQMYEKSRREDAIIDCAIGLESTLIRDGGSIQERGTVLLENDDHDPSFIYDYLSTFWNLRNNIVHTDKKITSYEVDGDQLQPKEIITYARYFLSRVICEYSNLDQEYPDKNITQINQDVIAPKIASRLVLDQE